MFVLEKRTNFFIAYLNDRDKVVRWQANNFFLLV